MRFRTRAFLLCFVPFTLLLTVSFWLISRQVQSAVRDGIRLSLRENQRAFAQLRSANELQNSRFLRVASENAALKAGIQLLLSDRHSEAARNTVEDQLREMCDQMVFDLLTASTPNGDMLAGVRREGAALIPLKEQSPTDKLVLSGGRVVEIASVPVEIGLESVGTLSVGQYRIWRSSRYRQCFCATAGCWKRT